MLVGLLWVSACTGYPGADNNTDDNDDRRDSRGHPILIYRPEIPFQWEKINHEIFSDVLIEK
jgi:hypothetical protein